uniref:Uncharacterized protein n=1 Tax=Coccidioides posadasii RMSCC 3488 TaxID=454284 RepID=A0A0J6EXG2_COCPO|nr:hypothetical protein CPAG_01587 [Coccidioides posadasii RMSCC 3488]
MRNSPECSGILRGRHARINVAANRDFDSCQGASMFKPTRASTIRVGILEFVISAFNGPKRLRKIVARIYDFYTLNSNWIQTTILRVCLVNNSCQVTSKWKHIAIMGTQRSSLLNPPPYQARAPRCLTAPKA